MTPKIGELYKYKRDGRIVKVVQVIEKTNRVEVIIGCWNPFWLNFNNLECLSISILNHKK